MFFNLKKSHKMIIDDNTPIAALTVGQFKEHFEIGSISPSIEEVKLDYTEDKYKYGLKGIREIFNVSHATAQKYKNTFLKDAITQHGRKIIVDVEKARELFAKEGGRNA